MRTARFREWHKVDILIQGAHTEMFTGFKDLFNLFFLFPPPHVDRRKFIPYSLAVGHKHAHV